jgi:hypothetical protein
VRSYWLKREKGIRKGILEEEDKKKAKTKQDQKHYTVEGVEGVLR